MKHSKIVELLEVDYNEYWDTEYSDMIEQLKQEYIYGIREYCKSLELPYKVYDPIGVRSRIQLNIDTKIRGLT